MQRTGANTTRVCFFVRVADRAALERVEFYAQDIQILRELGYDVHIATRIRDIRPADVYFIWWWTWAFAPLFVAWATRKPSIVTGVFDLPSFEGRTLPERRMMALMLRVADVNVFCSRMEARDIPKRFPTRDPRYIPLSVDTSRYVASAAPKERMILTVGLMDAGNALRKGMPEFIRAAAVIHQSHPDLTFLIAGRQGSDYPVLDAIVTEVGAREYVRFLGSIPVDEKIRLMQQCVIYLQPTRHEGFGLAILEALSCGAAVVTRDAGAVAEVVGDSACLVAGTTPEEIAHAVNELLANPVELERLRARARSRATEMYSYERRRDSLQRLVQSVL